LLAGENISIEHKKVRTASFDVEKRVLTLPIYKADIESCVYDTFVAHEVGHALYTPSDTSIFEDRKLFRYINLCEDIRIERLIKSKFPGLVRSFFNGYQQLEADNFFGVEDLDIEELSFSDRLNLNSKILSDGFFNEEEEILANKAKKALTFDEVVAIAKEIQEYDNSLKEEEDENQEGENDENKDGEPSDENEEGEEDTKGGSGNAEAQGESSEGDDDSDGDEDGEGDDEGDDESDEEGDEKKHGKKSGKSSGGNKKKRPTEMITDDAADESKKKFIDDKAEDIHYYEVGDIKIDDFIVSYSQVASELNTLFADAKHLAEFTEFKSKNQSIVNYLHKEFEMKKNAEQHKRAAEATSGTLDVNKIHSYKFNDNIFKKITSVPDGKSHGLVMLLDFSGSMNNKIMDTVKQLINLVLFCKRAGIDFEVYAFSQNGSEANTIEKYKNLEKGQIALIGGFELLNFVSSKQSGAKFNEALLNLWEIGLKCSGSAHNSFGYGQPQDIRAINNRYSLNSTPLNSVILTTPKLVEKFRSAYKSQVVHVVILTDGEATDSITTLRYADSDGRINRDFIQGRSFIKSGHKTFSTKAVEIRYRDAANETAGLLNYVKEVAKVNIIGFFLVSNVKEFCMTYDNLNFGKETNWEKKSNEQAIFLKEGNYTMSNVGYNEVYIIKADKKSLGLDDSSAVKVEYTDVKAAMKDVRAELKGIGNSIKKQRVFLNKFIAQISSPKHF
jgi:hypothetical protein